MTFRASPQLVGDYFRLFVNRRAYTVQSARPHPESGRHYYYRPTATKTGAGLSLTAETLRQHLEGEITIPRCGINPATQGCKWIAIDADYKYALERLIGNRCCEFMWMWRESGMEFYKHIGTRRYLLLDSKGGCYRQTAIGLDVIDVAAELKRVRGH